MEIRKKFALSVILALATQVSNGHITEFVASGRCLDSSGNRYDFIEFQVNSFTTSIEACQAKCEEVANGEGLLEFLRGIDFDLNKDCRCLMEDGFVPSNPGDASGRTTGLDGTGVPVNGNNNRFSCYKFIMVDPCPHRLGIVVDRTWEGDQTYADTMHAEVVSFAKDFVTDLSDRIGPDDIRISLSTMMKRRIRTTTPIDSSAAENAADLITDLSSGRYIEKGIPGVFTKFAHIFRKVATDVSSPAAPSTVLVISDGNERNGKRLRAINKSRRRFRRSHKGISRTKILCYSPIDPNPGSKFGRMCNQVWKVNEEGGKTETEIFTEITNHLCPPRSMSDVCSELPIFSCEAVKVSSDGTLGGNYNLCYWSNKQGRCRVRGKYGPLIDFGA